ncbi:hypothetical protein Tco_1083627 [Tanacetum coccineum]
MLWRWPYFRLTRRQMDLLVGSQAKDDELTGWELALVSTPSTNISSFQERQTMKNALEWLRSERVEYQRLADVLILKVNVCFLGDCLFEAFISPVVPRPEPVLQTTFNTLLHLHLHPQTHPWLLSHQQSRASSLIPQ